MECSTGRVMLRGPAWAVLAAMSIMRAGRIAFALLLYSSVE